MLKERIYALDWIRVLACLMVIFMHAPLSIEGGNSLFLLANSYFTAPCIGLFFYGFWGFAASSKNVYSGFSSEAISKSMHSNVYMEHFLFASVLGFY